KPGSAHLRKLFVDDLPIQRMPEFVACGYRSVGELVEACGLDDVMPFREGLAEIFDLVRCGAQRAGDRPGREAIARHARPCQNALLANTRLLELQFEHALQSLRDTGIDRSQRSTQPPRFP